MSNKIDHLVVLIHGLWGNPPHLNHLKQTLEDVHSKDNIHILIAAHNADYFTYDGIEVGAERVTNEVEHKIRELEDDGARLSKISVIGYSLGGVIARYTIGLLYKDGIFDKLKPINFTTFASLWIGIRSPRAGLLGRAYNAMGARTLSVTGRQMFTIDKFRDTGRPLLSVMADPSSIFVQALQQFKHKSLYANTMNDRSVPYYTGAFSRVNPFENLDNIDVHYLPGQDEKVLLDPVRPATLKVHHTHQSGLVKFRIRAQRFSKALPFYMLFTLLFPVAVGFMTINGVYQGYRSSNRIKLHESGKTLVDAKKYRIALLDETQAIQDRAIERLATSQPDDEAKETSGENNIDGFKPLSLTAEQLEMIDNLETIGITKYAAHIQNHRHTHAAIIVRYESPSFTEGVAVVNHWAQNFEA